MAGRCPAPLPRATAGSTSATAAASSCPASHAWRRRIRAPERGPMTTPSADRLRSGPPPVGTIVTVDSPNVADVLAGCGYDWLFVDLEHSALEIADAQRICQVAAGRCAVVLRLPQNDE